MSSTNNKNELSHLYVVDPWLAITSTQAMQKQHLAN